MDLREIPELKNMNCIGTICEFPILVQVMKLGNKPHNDISIMSICDVLYYTTTDRTIPLVRTDGNPMTTYDLKKIYETKRRREEKVINK